MVLLVRLVLPRVIVSWEPAHLEPTNLPPGRFQGSEREEILEKAGSTGFFQVFWLVFPWFCWFDWFFPGFSFPGGRRIWNLRICHLVDSRSSRGRKSFKRLVRMVFFRFSGWFLRGFAGSTGFFRVFASWPPGT